MNPITEVEQILEQLNRAAPGATTVELWVPSQLRLRGTPVPLDIAMAVILDRAWSLDLVPDGFVEGNGGRTYRYKRS
jgi:hypothetical protein